MDILIIMSWTVLFAHINAEHVHGTRHIAYHAKELIEYIGMKITLVCKY